MQEPFETASHDAITDTDSPKSDNVYPYWEKSTINWRLYVQPGMFGAGKTKEAAYRQTENVIAFHQLNISLPTFESISSE